MVSHLQTLICDSGIDVLCRGLARLLLAWPALLLGTLTSSALPAGTEAQRIVDLRSDITLEDDASLLVTETITVVAAGNQIRHGIYREFHPL